MFSKRRLGVFSTLFQTHCGFIVISLCCSSAFLNLSFTLTKILFAFFALYEIQIALSFLKKSTENNELRLSVSYSPMEPVRSTKLDNSMLNKRSLKYFPFVFQAKPAPSASVCFADGVSKRLLEPTED